MGFSEPLRSSWTAYLTNRDRIVKVPSTPRIKARYFAAFGEFVHEFAAVELMLNYVVRRYMNIDQQRYLSIFSALRMDRSLEYIRQLIMAGAVDSERRKEIEPIIAYLSIIQGIRNFIVHFGPTIHLGEREFMAKLSRASLKKPFVVAKDRYVTAARAKQLEITVDDFHAMIRDLREIQKLIVRNALSENPEYRADPLIAFQYKVSSLSPLHLSGSTGRRRQRPSRLSPQ